MKSGRIPLSVQGVGGGKWRYARGIVGEKSLGINVGGYNAQFSRPVAL